MLRRAIFEQLAAHEADEMDLIIDVRNRQRQRLHARAALLTVGEDRVGVRGRIHLLDHDVEQALRERLVGLEDEVALLRHAQIGSSAQHELARATEQRATVAAFLDEHTPVIDTTVGRPPAGGADWSLADAPLKLLDDADRCYTSFRAGLVEAVDVIVDSELLVGGVANEPHAVAQVVVPGVGPVIAEGGELAEFELVEHDPEAVAQVAAFVADVRMIGRAAELLTQRLRLAALQQSTGHPRDWLFGARLRRRDARNSLDRSRAVHAALAELAEFNRAELNRAEFNRAELNGTEFNGTEFNGTEITE